MKTLQIFVDNYENAPWYKPKSWVPDNVVAVGHTYIKLEGPGLPEVSTGQTASGYYGFYPHGIQDDSIRFQTVTTSSDYQMAVSPRYALTDDQYNNIIQYVTSEINQPSVYEVSHHNCVDFADTVYQFGNPSGNIGDVFSESLLASFENSGAAAYLGKKFHGWQYAEVELEDILSLGDPIQADARNRWVRGRIVRVNAIDYTLIRNDPNRTPDLLIVEPHSARQSISATSWGDPHLVTSDGLKYDFQQRGEYVLLDSPGDGYQLQVRQEKWDRNPKVSVNTALATELNGTKVIGRYQC